MPVFLDCPPDVARARIADDIANNRQLARDRTPEIVADVMVRFEPPPPNALVINSNMPAVDLCRVVVDAVARTRAAMAA